MDSTLASPPPTGVDGLVNGGGNNNNGSAAAGENVDHGDAHAVPAPEQQQQQQEQEEPPAKSYDDLFPSLPASAPSASGAPGAAPIGEWNRKPIMFASSTVTQVFRIPVEERKGAAAPSSANGSSFGEDSYRSLKKAMDNTGAKIEMSSAKDQSLTFLITGRQEQVMRARRELLTQFQTQASQVVAIPKEHHRFILGKGGQRLQELEAATATKISIPKANEASDKITVTGTKEGIEKAVHQIRVTSDEQVQ